MMTMIVVLISILIIIIFLNFVGGYLLSKNTNSIEELPSILKNFLDRGYNDATLVVLAQETKYFIQFSKYIFEDENYGFQLNFPKAKWSDDFYIHLEKYLKKEDISYKICKVEIDFIDVDFEKDIELAISISKYILTEIMRLPVDTEYAVKYNKLSYWDEVISSNNQKELTAKEGCETLRRYYKENNMNRHRQQNKRQSKGQSNWFCSTGGT